MRKNFPFFRKKGNALQEKELRVQFSAATDVGRVRETNQDNLYVMQPVLAHDDLLHYMAHGEEKLPALFAVCDGMGGGQNGELAAWEAVQMIGQTQVEELPEKSDDEIEKFFCELCRRISDTVFRMYGNRGVLVGATATLLYLDDRRIFLINVGDSPGIRFAGSGLEVMTQPDNRANQMYLMGQISEEERWTHATKNQLTQYIGMNPQEVCISPHVCRMDYPKEPTTYLICSDGLLDRNSFENLEHLFRKTGIEQFSDVCVKQAMACGSRDNITAIAVQAGAKET